MARSIADTSAPASLGSADSAGSATSTALSANRADDIDWVCRGYGQGTVYLSVLCIPFRNVIVTLNGKPPAGHVLGTTSPLT